MGPHLKIVFPDGNMRFAGLIQNIFQLLFCLGRRLPLFLKKDPQPKVTRATHQHIRFLQKDMGKTEIPAVSGKVSHSKEIW